MEQSLGSQEIAGEQKHQAKSSKSRADPREERVNQVGLENGAKILRVGQRCAQWKAQ